MTTRAFLADINLALETADETNLPLPGLETVQRLYDLLHLIGNDLLGFQSLALVYYDERSSERFGLDWDLAKKAMNVLEQNGDYDDDEDHTYLLSDDYAEDDFNSSYEDYDYYDDDYDDDEGYDD
jgi:3-hydroxyisobutyrate dehydrogenase